MCNQYQLEQQAQILCTTTVNKKVSEMFDVGNKMFTDFNTVETSNASFYIKYYFLTKEPSGRPSLS